MCPRGVGGVDVPISWNRKILLADRTCGNLGKRNLYRITNFFFMLTCTREFLWICEKGTKKNMRTYAKWWLINADLEMKFFIEMHYRRSGLLFKGQLRLQQVIRCRLNRILLYLPSGLMNCLFTLELSCEEMHKSKKRQKFGFPWVWSIHIFFVVVFFD